MTIRAPYRVMHNTAFKKDSFECEVFHETLGACWALSSRNVSGQFAVQLQIDLSRLQLLYGIPSLHLPEPLLFQFLQAFRCRPRVNQHAMHLCVEHHALELMENMNEGDFLNFTTGFEDAVGQILEPMECWTKNCQQAYLALKYYGLNLVESGMQQPRFKRTYADLLADYLCCTQRIFLQESKASTFYQ